MNTYNNTEYTTALRRLIAGETLRYEGTAAAPEFRFAGDTTPLNTTTMARLRPLLESIGHDGDVVLLTLSATGRERAPEIAANLERVTP